MPKWEEYFNAEEIVGTPEWHIVKDLKGFIPQLADAPAKKIVKAWRAFTWDYGICPTTLEVDDLRQFKVWLELKQEVLGYAPRRRG